MAHSEEDEEFARLCARIRKRSDDLDALLYLQGGLGGPLDPYRVDWDAVQSFLAPGFQWDDYSLVRPINQPSIFIFIRWFHPMMK